MPAAAIIGIGMAVGGIATAVGASSAAHAQENAAKQASATQQGMYNQTRADLSPYQQAGISASNDLTSRLPQLTSPFNMTQANLEQTPGYQFNLAQGLKSVNNAMGARGLLNSGAVMKGAGQYATGLADSTYMDQFNMDQQNKLNAYNKLMGVASLGEQAAGQTGVFAMQTGHDIASNQIGAGNAAAAGYMGIANGIGQAANGLSMAAMPGSFFNNMMNPLTSRTGIFGGQGVPQLPTGAYYGFGGGSGTLASNGGMNFSGMMGG